MKKYWDTSALLRAWKEGWIPEGGITRPHTVAEWVHIQVGRGMVFKKADGTEEKRALSWPTAAREVRRLVSQLTFVDLSGPQALDAVDAVAQIPNLKPSAVHDFMHIRAAELHQAKAVVTLNLAEWMRMTQLRVESPQPPGQTPA